ncbi:MAG: VCBS domain-containing protein, partial [Methyloprofundus sp.]|nr:VCBS domain-containing protein [Methyloprofundus sp.]
PNSRAETVTGQLDFSITQGTASVTGIVAGDATVVSAGNVGTIVDGAYGSIKVEANGSYTYTLTSNTTDHATQGIGSDGVQDVFSFAVTASNGNVATSTIKIDIIDDVPQAIDNAEQVTFGGLLFDNVITNTRNDGDNAPDDILGADSEGAKLHSVTFAGQSQDFEGLDPNDFLTFDTGNGTLFIWSDGYYEYEGSSTGVIDAPAVVGDFTPQSWGVASGTSIVDANGLLKLSGDAGDAYQGGSKPGVGVDTSGAQGASNAINDGETLVIDLGGEHLAGSITATIAQFNGNQSESGQWQAFNSTGQLVASGDFANTEFPKNGALTDVTLDIQADFTYLAFTFDTSGASSNQGYLVNKIEGLTMQIDSVMDTFNYQLQDGDGDLSMATLTISQVIGEINTGEDFQ